MTKINLSKNTENFSTKNIDWKVIQNEMRKEGKNDVQEILANQGIDGRSNQLNAIASITGEVAKGIGNAMGGGAVGGLNLGGASSDSRIPDTRNFDDGFKNAEQENSKTMMYLGGGAVVLALVYMMSKKKR